MARIEYYFTTISPYTYLAGMRLEEIAARRGAEIVYRPFGLLKVYEKQGTKPVQDRHPARQAYRLQDIGRVARFNGMKVNVRPMWWPANPVPSCAAIIAAQIEGGGDVGALAHAFARACWAEERDVADEAEVRAILAANGWDPAIADRHLLEAVERYESNTSRALEAGVFGAPSYLVGEALFWGQDRLPHLDAHLADLG
jgi:2-hydroxychromene-2-carboxylate isomerase